MPFGVTGMIESKKETQNGWPPLPQIVFVLLVISGLAWYAVEAGPSTRASGWRASASSGATISDEEVLPADGVRIPVELGNLGPQLVDKGVIDEEKFLALYEGTTLEDDAEKLLNSTNYGELVMTAENSPVILNFLWAFGLANKNPILEEGEMMNPAYGGAGNFASTGGWTISKGDAMQHYSKYALVSLTPNQQELVDKVSSGIYRPCCNNSTHFPDCNHGMAMLGLLELLASQGASEEEMYRVALAVNSYWFPDTYITIAAYKKNRGIEWKDVDAKEVLGADYSSASGFANVASKVTASSKSFGGGGCGVEQAPRQQSECGVGGQTRTTRPQSGCGV